MKPSAARVRDALVAARDQGRPGCTTAELCQPDVGGVRFGGRIHELVHEHGYEIEPTKLRNGSWLYTLRSEPPAGVGAGPSTPTSVDSGESPVSDGRRAEFGARPAADKSTDSVSGGAVAPSSGAPGTLFEFDDANPYDPYREAA
jgi:hypothetical protein